MNKQYRFTKQKRIVYGEVMSRCDHPTANDVFSSIHEKHPSISLSTVYRNLDVLAKEGLIKRIRVSGCDHFDLTLKDHNHILCKHCHKLVDLDGEFNHELEENMAKQTGFTIDFHNLVLEGICPSCQDKLIQKEKQK